MERDNVPPLLVGHNLYAGDRALREAVARENAGWADARLTEFGAHCGRAETIELGFLANENRPELVTHDRRGERVDLIRYHPAYHELMRTAIEAGLHASPWAAPKPGAHAARAAQYFLQTQVDAGHGCPVTMTFACVPTLRRAPGLAAEWLPRVTAYRYDPTNRAAHQKTGVTVGMAMTERQGGSDVRTNTTRAEPAGDGLYTLTGSKYFVSAPMSDAFLVLAQAPGGLSCFLLPRWLPDGSKNGLELQQLKVKSGNVSNASAEAELRGALAWRVGDEGRGIATIIEMVALTRYDCLIGSSAGMRQAVAQALHHCRHRYAFGAALDRQPLMQNVLADLALESEAATTMTMRLARALDDGETELLRVAAPVGKYWICKRVAGHAVEALECIGGMGVMETTIMPRLYREAPVNAIWEGSGNVQCLDLLRAARKSPDSLRIYWDELDAARGVERAYDAYLDGLAAALRDEPDEYAARRLVERLALAFQAAQLIRAQSPVAGAFVAARLGEGPQRQYGTLPRGIDCRAVIERARPE